MLKHKNLIFFCVLVFVFLITQTAVFAVTYEEISSLELYERIKDRSDKGYIILDIREPDLYELGHIPEAINIPLKELGIRFYELDKTKDIIVYCDYGIQSKVACQILINTGFKDVFNLSGGLEAWNYALVTNDKSTSI